MTDSKREMPTEASVLRFLTFLDDFDDPDEVVAGFTCMELRAIGWAAFEREKLAEVGAAAKAANAHWNEFGPEYDFDVTMDRLHRALAALEEP